MPFVYASGFGALAIPNATDTKVPVSFSLGDAALISGGCFVANQAGFWRFDAKVHADGKATRAKLLDNSGAEISFLAYSGGADPTGNNPIIGGWDVLNLAVGDKIWLGVTQSSGSTRNLSAGLCVKWMKLAATFIG